MIGDLMWKPFNVRFGDILERMSHHRELVKSELGIITARASRDAEAAAVEERSLAAKERCRAEAFRKQAQDFSSRTEAAWKMIEEREKGAFNIASNE